MKQNEIQGDNGLVINMPDGKPIVRGNYRSHYLWFGNQDGRCVGTLTNKAQLKKLRRWINEIIGETE